ncbi:hypothetical protein Pelo_9068 [Pelomyxa schiedti]|nr:hypothetical protein Pelo_9068 [Pelomyxa schiedti]
MNRSDYTTAERHESIEHRLGKRWSCEVTLSWNEQVLSFVVGATNSRCGAGSAARLLSYCPPIVRLIVDDWLRGRRHRHQLVREFEPLLSPPASVLVVLNVVTASIMVEVSPITLGVIGSPKLCGCAEGWLEKTGCGGGRSVVGHDGVLWDTGGVCVLVDKSVCNGNWAAMLSKESEVWIARVDTSASGADVLKGMAKVTQFAKYDFVTMRFVGRDMLAVESRTYHSRVLCQLVDVKQSFVNKGWCVVDSMSVPEPVDTSITTAVCIWDTHTVVGILHNSRTRKESVFAADRSCVIYEIPTVPGSTFTMLDSFLIVQPEMGSAEVWNLKDLAGPHVPLTLPKEVWLFRAGDLLAVVPYNAATMYLVDPSCGFTYITIKAPLSEAVMPIAIQHQYLPFW